MTAREWMAALAVALATVASSAHSQSLIETYLADIGEIDRRNSSGAQLSDPAAILTQDRANVHRFGYRQAGDTSDGIFQSREMRARMPSLLARGSMSPAAQAALRSGAAARLEVQIWGQGTTPAYLTVDLAAAGQAAVADPVLSPAELSRSARSIQSALNARGFDAGPVDGQPGQRTRSAIAAFQRGIGAAPTGVLTRSELAMLTAGAPSAGPSFDCRRAGTPTEIAICANPSLAALDSALAAAWNAGGRRADQAAWLRSRDACGADVACLEHSMRSRVFALGGSPGQSQASGQVAPGQSTATGLGALASAPAAVATAPLSSGPRAHFDQGTLIDAPDGLARRLALLEIKRDPSALDDTSVLDAIRRLQNAETDPADRTFNAMNAIEKEDSRAALRAALLQEAETVRPVTPEDPLAVTLYSHSRPREFVEGTGLELVGGAPQMVLNARPYPIGSIVVTLPDEISGPLQISRSEAAAFIDRVSEEHSNGRQPRAVIWGQITRIGQDDSVESFARQVNQRGAPATFEPLRAELHFVAMDSSRRSILPLEPGSEPVHRWPLGGAEAPSGRQSALALAQSLGLPTVDGALDVPLPAQQRNAPGWGQFTAFAWLGQHPDAPREGNAFVGVARGLLSEADHRSFFGQPRYPSTDIVRSVTTAGYGSDPFQDEFARRDAKRVFFERYYDSILTNAPSWPVQVRHSVVLRLGTYNFDTESFPLQQMQGNLSNGQFRVVDLPADARNQGLASAERFGNLPAEIQVPPDQARVLRQMAQDGLVQLVWWADFDYSVDTSAIEQAFGSSRNNTMRTGQGTLQRIGIYAGAALDVEVLSFQVEDLLIPSPETPTEPAEPVASDFAREVAEAETSDGVAIAGHVARLLGAGGFETVAKLMPEVKQANEFDAPGAMQAATAQLRAGAETSLVIRSGIALGTYDLENGTFGFRADGLNLRTRQGDLQVTISLVGPDAFAPLEMDQATARYIVDQRSRNIMLLAELTPETAERTHARTQNISLLARPERIVFYTQDENNLPKVLGERRFDEANSEAEARIARRFEPGEFAGLDEIRVEVTPHITDLIALRDGYEPSVETLPDIVAAAWAARDAGLPGPAVFEAGQARPDPVWITRHREMLLSWLQAKAAALGQDFTVRVMGGNDRSCGSFREAYGHLDQQVMTAVPSLREDQSDLARRLREENGPMKVSRRYAITRTRPHAEQDRCTNDMVILVLEDAIHEGRPSAGAVATQIAFTLGAAERVEGTGKVPGLVLRGAATGTRIEMGDGTLGPLLTPAAVPETGDTQQSVDAAQQAEAPPSRDEQIAAAQARISPQPSLPQPEASADWPKITLESTGDAQRDLLGIAPGQSMQEAAAMLSALDGVEAVFETAMPPDGTVSAAQRALGYQRVYLRRGGTEALTIASWAPEGEVVGIMRRMALADGRLPFDRIVSALTDMRTAVRKSAAVAAG
ncbi:hypothetical protein DC366_03600 [Pelagivirga sediminicola]|uniref:Peptidoglycan binding-like domain-containing protein n=1 Tax=Pelagivirga sediminicola TaxID=2170575 RepID=A0A2T7GC62_9RHOB|nr:peptidoglycan-binding protein [Pelagivirga sediminicola]PVA12015.1 hypothetical protein DC366_03600 [Pelagivirga sediminicola]